MPTARAEARRERRTEKSHTLDGGKKEEKFSVVQISAHVRFIHHPPPLFSSSPLRRSARFFRFFFRYFVL